MTCSASCRKKRDRMLARHRRENDLQEYRAAERQRQRESRKRRREQGGRGVVQARMSRAGFDPQLAEALDEILDFVDMATRVSRATLRRRLKKILSDPGMIERRDRENRGHGDR